MKAMTYKNERTTEVLADDKFLGYHFYVISYGTHPCAYVSLPESSRYYYYGYDHIPIDCHGGLTYADSRLCRGAIGCDGWYIGWDYAHCYDYLPYGYSDDGKKWTTEEMVEECKNVIMQLIELENSDL